MKSLVPCPGKLEGETFVAVFALKRRVFGMHCFMACQARPPCKCLRAIATLEWSFPCVYADVTVKL